MYVFLISIRPDGNHQPISREVYGLGMRLREDGTENYMKLRKLNYFLIL